MDRLTMKKPSNRYGLVDGCTLDDAAGIRRVIDRLAAYEDTGLEPERVAELAQAEKDGRLVVLPCKVGDMVYMPTERWNTITGYEEDICDGFHIAKDGVLQIKARCWSGNHGTYGVPGKTVFLTRDAAEAALEGEVLEGGT